MVAEHALGSKRSNGSSVRTQYSPARFELCQPRGSPPDEDLLEGDVTAKDRLEEVEPGSGELEEDEAVVGVDWL